MDDVQIKKRDGVLEAWNFDKLVASIGKSFIPVGDSEKIAKNVESWVKEKAKQGVIMSSEIRDKVVEELGKFDSVASENYRVFKK